ncbi:MAG: ATPase AAA [bacterium F082]|nr:MAG: ATPase AAA [bacterium F082]KWW31785.1 MAG: ATPase AAA [bacterium P201]
MYKRVLERYLQSLSKSFPIVSVTGPRQSGKTTLCSMAFDGFDYVNLEDEESRAIIRQDTKSYLREHSNGLIIDEAHYMPELFSALQVVSDEDDSRKYILSGSSNWLMMHNISQSLAGRVALTRLLPLSIDEIGSADAISTDELIYNGFYPAIWGKGRPARVVYDSYFSTYIQRDVRQIINIKDMELFRKFVRLCATRVGNEFIASNLANEVGVSVKTIQGWVSVLEASYVVFMLQPYYGNLNKRLTKTPKLYFYDTGLACYLLGVRDANDVANSPLRGALFENMVVADRIKARYNAGLDNNLFFYRDKSKHEVDLLMDEGTTVRAYEIKSATAFHTDFFSDLNYFRNLLGDSVSLTQVVYDGQEEWFKPDNGFLNFRHLQ